MYELVRWYQSNGSEKEYCYVIALFDKDKEGYDMRTIGDRFFEDKDAWVVAKYGLEFLNEIFEIERIEEELK
jgi:5S rRNA maturation endonuclease (ribonuclease M5)